MFPPHGSAEEMSVPFQGADIVVLGELHDNPAHHANQARIVRALQPSAIVFEMLTPELAHRALPEMRGNSVALEAALEWETRGWPDFAMYYPIFAAAPNAAIFGGALSQEKVRAAVADGAASTFGGSSSLFGLDLALPREQLETRLQLQQDAHCGALPENMLPGMVEAQRLRDAGLARATVAAMAHREAASEDGPVVVITGNGHAREDWGMPAALRVYYGNAPVDIRTLQQLEVPLGNEDVPFTTSVVTEPAERDDPCQAFAK